MWKKIKKILKLILQILSDANDAGLLNKSEPVPIEKRKQK